MSVYSIYFSPTGGTKKVMELLSSDWTEPATVVDLCNAETEFAELSLCKEDICLIGVPSFGGRVPLIALERLRSIQGNGAAAILVAVYGNRAFEDTLLELQDAVADCGFRTLAAVGAVAEHSIMHQYAAGRPDAQDEIQLRRFAERIRQTIAEGKRGALALPGSRPYREYKGVPLKPKVGKVCTKCGTCAKLCPVSAIPFEHPEQTDKTQCISCMRCLSVCPLGARSINKILLAAGAKMLKKDCVGRKNNELFLAE